ncbi:hypothetical protein CFC21_066960 [Triticum aestivum]|uniref:Uncharacterized protein n=2 Tax=Triticum aestivum TaxID=4565 RepID=A0A9R1KN31_WHEAT|nr:hypothetical protein CFC21_066960 [Triticum aestivum]
MYREVLGGEAAYAAAPSTSSTASRPGAPTSSAAPTRPSPGSSATASTASRSCPGPRSSAGSSTRGRSVLVIRKKHSSSRRGLITRNVKAAVDLFHQRFGMTFVPALSREFRPYKPDPAPLLHICSTWDIPPTEVIMVGDSLKDDIVCGKRAGAFTCLLDETGRYGPHESLPEDVKPDFMVSSLPEVLSVLEEHFDLAPVSVAESRI